jgi:hypothetical protein
MEARSSLTVRYSSASLASSSRAWANCASTSAPAGVLGPAASRGAILGAGVTSPSPAPTAPVAFAGSLAMTTQHSHAGS